MQRQGATANGAPQACANSCILMQFRQSQHQALQTQHVRAPEELLPAVGVVIARVGVEGADGDPARAQLRVRVLHEAADVRAREGDAGDAVAEHGGDAPAHVCPTCC